MNKSSFEAKGTKDNAVALATRSQVRLRFWVLTSLTVFFGAWMYATMHLKIDAYYDAVGPRAFPFLVVGTGLIAGFWTLWDELHIHETTDNSAGSGAAYRRNVIRALMASAYMILYTLLFEPLGFVISTFIMLMGLTRMYGSTWRNGFVLAISAPFVLFWLFDTFLEITLPAGLMS